jgi:hypothetical protein
VLVVVGLACQDGSIGPPDSFKLATATGPIADGLLPLRKVDLEEELARPWAQALASGVGAELIGTVYLTQRLLRQGHLGDLPISPEARSLASAPITLVLGAPEPAEGRGLRLPRTIGGPVPHPAAPWVTLPTAPTDERERAVVLGGRLATLIARLVATGGRWQTPSGGPPSALLETGYRMATEVIAREWKTERGPRGARFATTSSEVARDSFAAVRKNEYVLAEDGGGLKPPAGLLNHPGVVATVLYRMAQTRALASRPARAELYAPFVQGPIPAGVNPAALLGTFRNFQAKLVTAWMRAVLAGNPPVDLADLVLSWGAEFPEERAEVIRIFVVTTYGGTLKEGGVSRDPAAASAAMTELEALVKEVVAGSRTLRGQTPRR